MILLETLNNPQTWSTLAVAVILMIAQFLFVGENAIARKWINTIVKIIFSVILIYFKINKF